LIRAIEVAFERIDVGRPELTELGQPGIDFLQWFWLQPVKATLRIDGGNTGVISI